MDEQTEQYVEIDDAEVERRWAAGNKPMTAAGVADFLSLRGKPWEAVARIMRRDPSFPRPITRGGGRGLLWFRNEINAWLHAQPRVDSVRHRARGLQS